MLEQLVGQVNLRTNLKGNRIAKSMLLTWTKMVLDLGYILKEDLLDYRT